MQHGGLRLERIKTPFIVTNSILALLLVGLFVGLASSSDANTQKLIAEAGTVMIGAVALLICLGIAVYGGLLLRTLSKASASGAKSSVAKRLQIGTISLSVSTVYVLVTSLKMGFSIQ